MKSGEVNKTEDLPLAECAQKAEELISAGFKVYQKFTCEMCGTRLFFAEANIFYKSGSCDKCGHVTKIKYCGFAVIAGNIKLEDLVK